MATSALVGALRVTLGLDSAAFEKGADRAVKKMDFVSKAGFRTGRALRGLAGLAATAGVALVGVFSTGAIKNALDYAASIGEVASQLGVTTKELQVYRYAATQVNLTQEEVEKGLAKLTLTLGKAGTGAKREAQYFSTLGIAIKDAEGQMRPTGDVLLDLADRLAAIPDPAQRAAAVFSIFGRAGQKMIPLLEQGSDGLKKFAKDAEEAGLVLTEGDIAKADETADKIEKLTTQLKVNFSATVAKNADAILGLTNVLGSLLNKLIQIGGWFARNPQIAGLIFGGLVGGRFGGLPGAIAGGAAGFFLAPDAARTSADVRKDIEALRKRGPVVAGGKQGVLGELFTVRSTDKSSKAYQNQLKSLQSELKKVEVAEAAAAKQAAAFGANVPDLGELFSTGGGGGGGGGKKARDEIGAIREQLAGLDTDIEAAFDTRNLPESIETADELRRKLDDIADEARKAGVPLSAFSDQMAVLRTRISELELDGLADEAAAFSRSVEEAARVVTALDLGAMTPLEQRIADVDDRYNDLRDRIIDQIEENAVLALANEEAARAMADLVGLLGRLDDAHRKAAEAARLQYQAEQALRDLAAQQAGQQIGNDITDLRRARGDEGVFTSNQLERQQLERQLQSERMNALIQLRDFEAQLEEARIAGDVAEANRLTGLIGLQNEYYDLVSSTTAKQILASQRLQDAFEDFTSGIGDAFADMLVDVDFSLQSVLDVFRQTLRKILSDTFSDAFGGLLKGGLNSLFAGGFATGGIIPKGQWGIVGERGPEPIFAADGPLRILPNDVLGGGQTVHSPTFVFPGISNERQAREAGSQAALRYRQMLNGPVRA